MNGELKKIIDQAKALWAKLPTTSRMVVILVVLGSVAGTAFLGFKGPTENYAVLFSGLQTEDAAKVVEQLKADNTPYRITGADTIEVPAARVHELRLSMAGAGLPRGGAGPARADGELRRPLQRPAERRRGQGGRAAQGRQHALSNQRQ